MEDLLICSRTTNGIKNNRKRKNDKYLEHKSPSKLHAIFLAVFFRIFPAANFLYGAKWRVSERKEMGNLFAIAANRRQCESRAHRVFCIGWRHPSPSPPSHANSCLFAESFSTFISMCEWRPTRRLCARVWWNRAVLRITRFVPYYTFSVVHIQWSTQSTLILFRRHTRTHPATHFVSGDPNWLASPFTVRWFSFSFNQP